MKKGFLLPPARLNLGYVISAAGFFLYLLAAGVLGQSAAGVVAIVFGVFAVYTFLSVAMARKTEKERVGYHLLWGTGALALMLGAFAVLSVKLWLGL